MAAITTGPSLGRIAETIEAMAHEVPDYPSHTIAADLRAEQDRIVAELEQIMYLLDRNAPYGSNEAGDRLRALRQRVAGPRPPFPDNPDMPDHMRAKLARGETIEPADFFRAGEG